MIRRYGDILILFLILVPLIFGGILQVPSVLAAAGTTTLVSISTGGVQGNNDSLAPSTSNDGRYVAFESAATNLVTNDTNSNTDIFIRDRFTGTTTMESISSASVQGNGYSIDPSISSDGRFVAFESSATNLIDSDTNGYNDVFIRNRTALTTTRVSVSSTGVQADKDSGQPSVSSDGNYVAFASNATNLVTNDTNNYMDVFVRNRLAGTTTRVSVSSEGDQSNSWSEHPSISSNGQYIAFESAASDLVNDDNNGPDIFVHDLINHTTTRVSLSASGAEGNGWSSDPSISSDGALVAFASMSDNLVTGDNNGCIDVFVHNSTNGATTIISASYNGGVGNDQSADPSISSDGRYVAFHSYARNLINGDDFDVIQDAFVRDRITNQTTQVSVSTSGVKGNQGSSFPSISSSGNYVAFQSWATNLVVGDTNSKRDIFINDQFYTGHTSDEIGVWRGSTRYFYLDTDDDGKYTNPAAERRGTFLSSYVNGDAPVAGDWDNDGTDEIGVWRKSTRYFYLDKNGDGKYTNPATERLGPFLSATQANDRPIAGDWNGTGTDEIGVWRGSTRYFYLDKNNNGKYDGTYERLGPFLSTSDPSDRPVVGDWNGDGTDEIGVWRGATRYFYLDTNGNGVYNGIATERLGPFLSGYVSGDAPVAGDWDRDGSDEVGVWRKSTRYFYLDTNGDGKYTNSATERLGPFLSSNNSTDAPVAGNWDGL